MRRYLRPHQNSAWHEVPRHSQQALVASLFGPSTSRCDFALRLFYLLLSIFFFLPLSLPPFCRLSAHLLPTSSSPTVSWQPSSRLDQLVVP